MRTQHINVDKIQSVTVISYNNNLQLQQNTFSDSAIFIEKIIFCTFVSLHSMYRTHFKFSRGVLQSYVFVVAVIF